MTKAYCVCREPCGCYICTCSSAHAPGGEAVRRCEAVEHTNILRCQELHKLGVLEHISFAVEDGGSLIRNVDYPSCVERNCYCENVLLKRQNPDCVINEKIDCSESKLFLFTAQRQYMQLKR